MAHLEDPSIDVKPIGPKDEAYRVTVESRTTVLKFDLAPMDLYFLIEEGLEALLTHEAEQDDCTFCGSDGGLDDDARCELVRLSGMLRDALRTRKHKGA